MEVYYISAGQTSLLQVQCKFYIGRGLPSRNIVHLHKKTFYVVSVSAFIFFIAFVKSIRSLYSSNVYQQDHRSGCLLIHFIAIVSLIITNLIVLKTKITFIQSIKKTMEAPIVFKEIKYAAKDKKDVPFVITNSGKRWAI